MGWGKLAGGRRLVKENLSPFERKNYYVYVKSWLAFQTISGELLQNLFDNLYYHFKLRGF